MEIVNDTVSVIVIDSEEESSGKETETVKNRRKISNEYEKRSSPSPDRSPILPSGDSLSESEDEIEHVVPTASKPNAVKDDTAQLDHVSRMATISPKISYLSKVNTYFYFLNS